MESVISGRQVESVVNGKRKEREEERVQYAFRKGKKDGGRVRKGGMMAVGSRDEGEVGRWVESGG